MGGMLLARSVAGKLVRFARTRHIEVSGSASSISTGIRPGNLQSLLFYETTD